jgi:hypothetical protein
MAVCMVLLCQGLFELPRRSLGRKRQAPSWLQVCEVAAELVLAFCGKSSHLIVSSLALVFY